VLVNVGGTPRTVRMALARGERAANGPLPVTPHVTSKEMDLKPGDPVDAAAGVTIPARSVVTLVTVP